ncbi:hypothetical protein TRAPUB_12899 [Trametes pubescens]|uniref:Uncharacterized protein n=1 Tax=Trametes pubescens TaxID=154538 RepID=A0A1M2VST6_TRAPU|nr:hypothetical protein TRAPUB_12899 [Trametes pubescens]
MSLEHDLMVFEKWLLDCAYILPSSAEKALERVQAADTNTGTGASAAVRRKAAAAPVTQPQAGSSTQAESEEERSEATTRKSKCIALKGKKSYAWAAD